MNKSDLQERLKGLRAESQQLQQQFTAIGANISAYNGAMQECEYWLKIVEDAEAAKEVHPEVEEIDTGDSVSFT